MEALIIISLGIAAILLIDFFSGKKKPKCPHCNREYYKPIRRTFEEHETYYCPHCGGEMERE
ncbi:zf-TFIIB domain-containing protein [Jeotgalibacillus soli]|uniref:Uncharacterized protein n=1 Tax=Jeotgalibacillus soli TaxID=889306 RepID=A0A0C2VK22_9BACL|nr:zf-TFIIB domain-containing protein [Jeotgalibacillus soli]KIL44343.1 hypothetical protein KP78_33070 [Jeotgalibacillus soli]